MESGAPFWLVEKNFCFNHSVAVGRFPQGAA